MIPYKDEQSYPHTPLMTWLLIIINLGVFLLGLTSPDGGLSISQSYALYPTHFNLINLITYQFIHSGWLHILGNMLFLWVFGPGVEYRLGSLLYLFFYLVAGAIGGYVQALFIHDAIPIIGASASIAGVLGAYLVWYPQARIRVLVPLIIFWWTFTLPAFLVLVLWFVTNLFNSYTSLLTAQLGGVAYLGHVGGFIFGIIIALFFPFSYYKARSA